MIDSSNRKSSAWREVAKKVVPSGVRDQIRPYVPATYRVLGTDGYGRSDRRTRLRQFFEVDRRYVTVAALTALADDGKVDRSVVPEAIRKYGIDPDVADPATV